MLTAQSCKFQGVDAQQMSLALKGRCRSQFFDFASFWPKLFYVKTSQQVPTCKRNKESSSRPICTAFFFWNEVAN